MELELLSLSQLAAQIKASPETIEDLVDEFGVQPRRRLALLTPGRPVAILGELYRADDLKPVADAYFRRYHRKRRPYQPTQPDVQPGPDSLRVTYRPI